MTNLYIAPNTTIRLIKNCPLDNKYEHTIFFRTPSAQYTYYYNTLNGILFNNQSYQRVNKNKMRVQYNAESLYDVNYLKGSDERIQKPVTRGHFKRGVQ